MGASDCRLRRREWEAERVEGREIADLGGQSEGREIADLGDSGV